MKVQNGAGRGMAEVEGEGHEPPQTATHTTQASLTGGGALSHSSQHLSRFTSTHAHTHAGGLARA